MAPAAAAAPLPRLSRIRSAFKTMAERLGPRMGIGLLAAGIVMVLLVVLASEVLEGETQHFDDAVRLTVYGVASPHATSVLYAVTQLGSPLLLIPGTLVCSLLFLHLRRIRGAILLTLTMVGVTLLNWILKAVFQRPRPLPFFGLTTPTSYSFPSGHALAAFCFYGALAALVTARLRSPLLRVLVWASAAAVIVAGYATGFVWVLTVASADRLFLRADQRGAKTAVAEPPPGGPA